MDYDLAIKRNTDIYYNIMNLKNIMQSERSQTQKGDRLYDSMKCSEQAIHRDKK